MRIAVLESDTHDAQVLEDWLRSAGNTASRFATESGFMREFKREKFDLVIAGSVAHGAGGAEIILSLRAQLKLAVPIIRILKKDIENDIVAALKAGADDCVVKPLRQLELLARVAALARRTQPGALPLEEQIEFSALCVDLRNRVISRNGKRLTLTPKTYDLAVFLLTHTGQLLSRTYLMEQVWGCGRSALTRTLDTHISRLRSVLGLTPDNGWKLQSVYQHGYRLDRTEAVLSVGDSLIAGRHEQSCKG